MPSVTDPRSTSYTGEAGHEFRGCMMGSGAVMTLTYKMRYRTDYVLIYAQIFELG